MDNSNYFDLPEPESLKCRIWQYQVHLGGALTIQVYRKPDTTMWLIFPRIVYFEGMLGWTGANFKLGTSEELLSLARIWFPDLKFEDEEIIDGSDLFLVEPTRKSESISDNPIVRIVASEAYKRDKPPT